LKFIDEVKRYSRAGVDGGGAGGAEGTLGWFPHFGGEVEEAEEGVVSVGYGAAAAVDEDEYGGDFSTGVFDDVDALLDATAAGDDIFSDDVAVAGFNFKTAHGEEVVLFFGKE